MSSRKRSLFDDSDSDEEDSNAFPSKSPNGSKTTISLDVPESLDSPDTSQSINKINIKPTSEENSSTGNDKPIEPLTGQDSKEENAGDSKEPFKLTPAQKARIEQNRQRALIIRRNKMNKALPAREKYEL